MDRLSQVRLNGNELDPSSNSVRHQFPSERAGGHPMNTSGGTSTWTAPNIGIKPPSDFARQARSPVTGVSGGGGAFQSRARSSFLSTFPEALRGSSATNVIPRGAL